MSEFQFDTSGVVHLNGDRDFGPHRWSDLSPFAQGYAYAAALTLWQRTPEWARVDFSFSNFAGETVALIMEDCEQRLCDGRVCGMHHENNLLIGGWFWECRQSGTLPHLPPLTVYLGDDGTVRFR